MNAGSYKAKGYHRTSFGFGLLIFVIMLFIVSCKNDHRILKFDDGAGGFGTLQNSSGYAISKNGDTLYHLDGTLEMSGYYDISESQREHYYKKYIGENGVLVDYYDSSSTMISDQTYFWVSRGKMLQEKYHPQFETFGESEKEIVAKPLPYFIRDEFKGQDTIKIAEKIKVVVSLGVPNGTWEHFGNNMNEYYRDSIQFDEGKPVGKWVLRTAPVLVDKVSFEDGKVERIETFGSWSTGSPSTKSNSFKIESIVYFTVDGKVTEYYDKHGRISKRLNEDGSEASRNSSSKIQDEQPNRLIQFADIKTELIDASTQKCEALLGSPDKSGYLYSGNENKIALVYINKIQGSDGRTKHLIVFLRSIYNVQKPRVEDIKEVEDGEKAYYGIHYVQVNGTKIQSNSRDFN